MEPFKIEIAGAVFSVEPIFASTREYCKRYLSEKEPVFRISVTEDDLDFEQKQLEKEAVEQHIRPRKFPGPFLERATILRKAAVFLLKSDTLLIHGSTVAVDGSAYLFTAPCGTGKSTHTRLWRQVFGDRAVMINDDKAFLRVGDDGIIAFGSPWSGKHGLDTNMNAPLRGICVIGRGNENRIVRHTGDGLFTILQDQLLGYTEETDLDLAWGLLHRLVSQVPVWNLTCNMDPEAARVSYGAMSL